MPDSDSLHARLLTDAYRAALSSDHITTRVGAAIADESGRRISRACNGFPRGLRHTPERITTPELWDCHALHAEMRAVLGWIRHGNPDKGSFMIASTHTPCAACASLLVALMPAGLNTVILDACLEEEEAAYTPKWKQRVILGRHLLEDNKMRLVHSPASASYPKSGDMAGSWWQLKKSFDQIKNHPHPASGELDWGHDPLVDWRDDPFVAALIGQFITTGRSLRGAHIRLPLEQLHGPTALILIDLQVAHVELATSNPAHHAPEQAFALGLLREAQLPFTYAEPAPDIAFHLPAV